MEIIDAAALLDLSPVAVATLLRSGQLDSDRHGGVTPESVARYKQNPPSVRINMLLDPEQAEIAKTAGNGTTTAGIRHILNEKRKLK